MDGGSIPPTSTSLMYYDDAEVNMSATAELLLEQITEIKAKVEAAQERGEDTTRLFETYRTLWNQYSAAQNSLNESKQLLKG